MRISALLVALLGCATTRVAVVAASACDGISCGMGTCTEVPPLVPFLSNVSTYKCDCDPGWLNFDPLVALTACYIPNCFPGISCYHPSFKLPPLGSNVTLHPCLGMDCGEGTCVEEQSKPICQCNPGAANLRDDPSFPCTTNCFIGQDGCPVPNLPPSSPSPPSSAPPGNDHESSGPTAPSGTKGYVCSQNLLLLALLALLHVDRVVT